MSLQEVVFNNNVIVRNIVNNLLDGYENLLNIALVNRTFHAEVCHSISQTRVLSFSYVSTLKTDDDLDETQPLDDAEYDKMVAQKLGFEFGRCFSIFHTNLKFISQNSRIHTIDFSKVALGCELTPLTTLTSLKEISFAPADRASSNPFYLQLIENNHKTLRKLVNPPENFFKLLLKDIILNLDLFEGDISIFRSMSAGIHEGKDVFMCEAYEDFDELLRNKIKMKKFIVHGHDRARFQPYYQVLLTESQVTSIKFVSDNDRGDELLFFNEWKNRNQRFVEVAELEMVFSNDGIKTKYDQAMLLVTEIFPHLSDLIFTSRGRIDTDQCFEVLELIAAYWRKNVFISSECKHHIHLTLTQGKESDFEKRLYQNRNYHDLVKTSSVWFFSLCLTTKNKLFITLFL